MSSSKGSKPPADERRRPSARASKAAGEMPRDTGPGAPDAAPDPAPPGQPAGGGRSSPEGARGASTRPTKARPKSRRKERGLALAGRIGLGVALLTLGLVGGERDAVERIREALPIFEASQARTEHARALVELGAALRRGGHRKESREPLREGLDMAHRCGSVLISRRGQTELEAAGARPRRVELTGVESLTPSERRIGAMAAEGLSNPQIAQALFLTRRTVEMHLTNAYRKLEISSRDELPEAITRQTDKSVM